MQCQSSLLSLMVSYLHNFFLSVDTDWLGNTYYWPMLSIHNPASHSAFSAATLQTADKQGVKQGDRIGNVVNFQSKTQHLQSKYSASDLHFSEGRNKIASESNIVVGHLVHSSGNREPSTSV